MILHRDFMIPIMNFYRIRDLHRDLRSILCYLEIIFFTIRLSDMSLYFRYTISYFRLDKVIILITSTIRISLYEEWWKLSISYFIHLRYDSFENLRHFRGRVSKRIYQSHQWIIKKWIQYIWNSWNFFTFLYYLSFYEI